MRLSFPMKPSVLWALVSVVQIRSARTLSSSCNFQRRDGRALTSKDFKKIRAGRIPVVLTGMQKKWPAARKGRWTREEFTDLYGRLVVDSGHVSSNNLRGDEGFSEMTLAEAFESFSNRTNSWFLMSHHELVKALRRAGDWHIPEQLSVIQNEGPYVSLGSVGQGNIFHQHDENWAAQVVGSKRWLVDPGSPEVIWNEGVPHPCSFPEDITALGDVRYPRPSLQCTVKAGEIVYVPPQMLHATCCQAEWNAGVAYIGRIDDVADPLVPVITGDFHQAAENFRDGPPNEMAVNIAVQRGRLEMVALLLQSSPDIAGFVASKPDFFLNAVNLGHVDIASFLIQLRADVQSYVDSRSMPDPGFWTAEREGQKPPLCLASTKGHKELVRLLIANRASTKAKDSLGRSALHYAAKRGHRSVAMILLQHRANLNARAIDDHQPIHYASAEGRVGVLKFLLDMRSEATAGILSTDGKKGTPLHLTAQHDFANAAEVLLAGSQYESVPWALDETMQIAHSAGHSRLTALLAEHGATLPQFVQNVREPAQSSCKNDQSAVGHQVKRLERAVTSSRSLMMQKRTMEAELVLRAAIDETDSGLCGTQRDLYTCVFNLGVIQHSTRKFEEAEVQFRRAAQGHADSFGAEDDDTQGSIDGLSSFLNQMGRHSEADALKA